MSRPRVALWLATPFLTGAAIMSLELVAFRLYAPFFGYSIVVWGSTISIMMAALAVGYAVGGWASDREPNDLFLYGGIVASALYQVLNLFVGHAVLSSLAGMGAFTGTALASLVIFAPPMMVLAAACPFVVRLLADSGGIGSASGKVYALSTIGGIAGILATSFLLVPYEGTQKTLEAICLVTAATGLAGLAGHLRRASLAFGAILALVWIGPGPSWPPGTLWAADSPYNLVRVVRDGDLLVLKLNSDSGVHTIRNERTGWTGHYYDDFSLGPLLVPAKSLLVLGLGGGGSIASTRITAPDVDIDAVEIDPRVVEAAVRFFGVRQSERLRIHVADARPWLKGHPGRYDIVHVDLYQGGPYVPFYLLTREFFEDVRGHMSGDGLLMMNLLDVGRQKELLLSTVATLRKVFASVLVLPAGFGNHLIFAFSKDTPLPSVRERLGAFRGNPLVESRGRRAAIQIASSNVPTGTPEFTDDFAPVEEMTGRMLRESGSRWP